MNDPCKHDEKFRNVFFAVNGCIACECEAQSREAEAYLDALIAISKIDCGCACCATLSGMALSAIKDDLATTDEIK